MRGKILFVSPKMWFFIKQEFHAGGRDASNLPEVYGHISGTVGLAPADLEPGLLVEYAESKRNGRPCAVNIKRYVPATQNPEYPFEPTPEPVRPTPVEARPVRPKAIGGAPGAPTPTAQRTLSFDTARATASANVEHVQRVLSAPTIRLRGSKPKPAPTDLTSGE